MKSYDAVGCMAWVMDRDGNVVHAWKNHPGLWSDVRRVRRVPGISGDFGPASVHLCANGDLLATFHGFNTFPFAVGMARFDVNSNLLWKKEIFAHHSFCVADDGTIFVPSLDIVDAPVMIGNTDAKIVSESGKVYKDCIRMLDPDGNELGRIPILDALFNSGFNGHLIRENASVVSTEDPTHLNDVQLIGDAADQLDGINAGDLLVSLRNINLIGVLDPKTQRFKWLSCGASVGQHSPRPYKQGFVLLDNLGGDQELGGTQVVYIDYATGMPTTLLPRPGVEMPDSCRTINSGHVDIPWGSKHALVTVTHEGAIWEVDLETGEVEWEYIYAEPGTGGERRMILCSKYVDDLSFLGVETDGDA